MKNEGRSVIRLNDKTSHGGHVTTASGATIMGISAALENDMTYCPKCKGDFAIQPDKAGAKHCGLAYAYDNDVTGCGAKLIPSL